MSANPKAVQGAKASAAAGKPQHVTANGGSNARMEYAAPPTAAAAPAASSSKVPPRSRSGSCGLLLAATVAVLAIGLAMGLHLLGVTAEGYADRVAAATCRAREQHAKAVDQGSASGGFPAAATLLQAMWNATPLGEPKYRRAANPARGVYPKGCTWRDVQYSGRPSGFWDVVEYEYLDPKTGKWGTTQPEGCTVKGQAKPQGYMWPGGSPRSVARCNETYCLYENLWYNNGKFYMLVDGDEEVASSAMTRNQELNVMHVRDATEFLASVDYRVVKGDTLVFDFVHFLHPTAIGHWCEVMFPLYSILKQEPNFARPATQFMLLHLKRVHLMEWVRAVMAAALGVPPSADLPPMIMQQEIGSVWGQIPQPLEGYELTEWVSFERALVVRDTFTGGVRTFFSQEDAVHFREHIYKQYGLPPPAPRPVPRVITFQRKRANRRIINEEAFLRTLREFGEVRVVEFNQSSSFKEQLETMSSTGVYISVHTSNLANSPFLQPGSAVVELLQKNWIWENLDQSFILQTRSMGDIHHYAWRARHRNQTVYINKRDAERFGDWPSRMCDTEECVEAHTNVDVVVNIAELRALLADRLPLVWAGVPVQDAVLPWPEP